MASCLKLFGVLFLTVVISSSPSFASHESFSHWLAGLKKEASTKGISPATLNDALCNLKPIPRIIELDRKQTEFSLSFTNYLKRVVPEQRVKTAQKKFRKNLNLLEQIERNFGVDANFIVALWGIESDFGRLTGGFPVISALATLAYDGRRSDFFKKELIEALRIVDQGHVSLDKMTGSWAGAMGQVQFMPSSFKSYSVDFDGDGKNNIWTSHADAFSSAANYLSQTGWEKGMGWGCRVNAPLNVKQNFANLETQKTLAEWKKLGVRGINGKPDQKASLILPEGSSGPAFLVFDNFKVLLRWNRSTSFALAVSHLAEQIKKAKPLPNEPYSAEKRS